MSILRSRFNDLVETMRRFDLYQIDDEVGIALSEFDMILNEVEKRIECARRSNQDSNSVIMSLVDSYQDLGKTEEELTYGDFETLQRGVYDVDISLNFNHKEPIENNWYGLFEEPIKEEPKVIWGKGTIIEWKEIVKYFNAKDGARARVTEDYTTLCEMVNVEFLDDLSNGQVNGGYYGFMFKDEPIEVPTPTYQCKNTHTFDKVKEVIQILKTLDNGDCVDGETMQYILEQVGMEDQMLRQLIMSNPCTDTTDILEEKRILSNRGLLYK